MIRCMYSILVWEHLTVSYIFLGVFVAAVRLCVCSIVPYAISVVRATRFHVHTPTALYPNRNDRGICDETKETSTKKKHVTTATRSTDTVSAPAPSATEETPIGYYWGVSRSEESATSAPSDSSTLHTAPCIRHHALADTTRFNAVVYRAEAARA